MRPGPRQRMAGARIGPSDGASHGVRVCRPGQPSLARDRLAACQLPEPRRGPGCAEPAAADIPAGDADVDHDAQPTRAARCGRASASRRVGLKTGITRFVEVLVRVTGWGCGRWFPSWSRWCRRKSTGRCWQSTQSDRGAAESRSPPVKAGLYLGQRELRRSRGAI